MLAGKTKRGLVDIKMNLFAYGKRKKKKKHRWSNCVMHTNTHTQMLRENSINENSPAWERRREKGLIVICFEAARGFRRKGNRRDYARPCRHPLRWIMTFSAFCLRSKRSNCCLTRSVGLRSIINKSNLNLKGERLRRLLQSVWGTRNDIIRLNTVASVWWRFTEIRLFDGRKKRVVKIKTSSICPNYSKAS